MTRAWQTIDSAPTDGTAILVTNGSSRWIDRYPFQEDQDLLKWIGIDRSPPTHWCGLPEITDLTNGEQSRDG